MKTATPMASLKKRDSGGTSGCGTEGGRSGGHGSGGITPFFPKAVPASLRLEGMSFKDERFLLAAGGASSIFPSKTEDRANIRAGLELADAAYALGDEARFFVLKRFLKLAAPQR